MPVVVVGTEKNFAALRPRLFQDKVSNAVAGDVKEAIRAANPHVDLDKLTPGTVLTVPESPNVRVRGDFSLDETTKSAALGLTNVGKRALDDLAAAAKRSESAARAERKRALKSLDLVGAATRPRDAKLAKEVEAARETLTAEDEREKERAATLKQAQAEWTKGLEALRKLAD